MNDICIPTDSVRTLIKLINPVYTGYNLLRLGNEGDGGYLLPDCLSGMNVAYHQVQVVIPLLNVLAKTVQYKMSIMRPRNARSTNK